MVPDKKIVCGVDRLNDYRDELRMHRIALLTTGAAMDRRLNTTLQVVNNHFELTSLFGAEYGIMGEKEAGERYNSYQDIWTGLTVFSLYRFGSFHFTHEMLASFDVLLVDLPLSGLRYDSYINTIHRLLRQLGETDKKVVVLDRPDPLGAERVEGPVLDEMFKEDEDEFSLPIRYGLTLGELALMMNGEDQLNCKLEVIKVKNWSRAELQTDTDRPWLLPQLQYPNLSACLLAAGLEMFSGTNASYGMGTSLPYQVIGAPFIDGVQLAANLNKNFLPGIQFSPVYFTPSAGIYRGTRIQGVKINVTNSKKVKPVRTALFVISDLKRIAGEDFVFLNNAEENYLQIDHLFGNSKLSRQFKNSRELDQECERESAEFQERAKPYLLYE